MSCKITLLHPISLLCISHIARYAPVHRTTCYSTITQFECITKFQHLLKKKDTSGKTPIPIEALPFFCNVSEPIHAKFRNFAARSYEKSVIYWK